MGKPKVSVVMPTYNQEQFVAEAIQSVLDQDFEDFELIVGDDASNDRTAEICREFERKDSRVRLVRHLENKGMVENWNWCNEQACGEYIKPMLGDDKFNSSAALRRLVEALDRCSRTALVTSSRLVIDEEGAALGTARVLGSKDRVFGGKCMIKTSLFKDINLIGEPTAVMFRRRNLHRGFDPSYRQLVDLEMWFYLLGFGNLAYIAEPLCSFRRHSSQQTEVNKVDGVGEWESFRLLEDYGQGSVKRYMFMHMYQMIRCGDPKYEKYIVLLRRKFSRPEYVLHFIIYKLLRPFRNLRRSINKRVDWFSRFGSIDQVAVEEHRNLF